MHDTLSGPNPLSPDSLSTDERLGEIGRILAAGVGRLHLQKSSSLSAAGGDSSLDILALKSGGGRREPRNRIGGR